MHNSTSRSEPERVFLHLKALFSSKSTTRKSNQDTGKPFEAGRDPKPVSDVLTDLTEKLGWENVLSESDLLENWADVVGSEVASHSTPQGIQNGILIISCDSTPWAAQLRLMRNELLERINLVQPNAQVKALRFLGPDVPTWKKGLRSIPGRGPRDTYG